MQICNSFKDGLKDGIPIGLGYFSVSFTFGMMAVSNDIPVWIAVIISFTNLTSAGQFAGLQLIIAQGAYIEMILTQLIINMRYALMSLSLSQKLDMHITRPERCLIAYGNTDEIFAIASSKPYPVGKRYLFGLMSLPIICWTFGTLIGGIASTILSDGIADALGIAIYGMFIAIIIPPAKSSSSIRKVLLCSILLSFSFTYLPILSNIGSGFSIILCTIIASGLGAWLFPIQRREDS